MPSVRIEFLVEPFSEGSPGPHVQAGIDAVRFFGHEPEVGPFGTVVTTPDDEAGAVVEAVVEATLGHGARHVSIRVDRMDE